MTVRRRLIALGLTCGLAVSTSAWAQVTDDATAVDAFRCWRRLGQQAVRVGERFAMTVTCSAVETEGARAIPDQVALEPASIDVAPFEVLDGERSDDTRTGPYRFFQYHYTLRLITETSFGEDVELPAVELAYRVERRIGNAPAMAGRERTYILPPEPIRVISFVPGAVVDIRDLAPATFSEAQARIVRANALTLGAALTGLLAVGVLLVGVTRAARARRGHLPAVERPVPPSGVVRRALDELTSVGRAAAEHGWTADTLARALSALRVGANIALTGRVAHAIVAADTPTRAGQLRLRHGLVRRRTLVVSSGLTAPVLARASEATRSPVIGDAALIADLAAAIAVFTQARYARQAPTEGDPTDRAEAAGMDNNAALISALDTGLGALTRLRWLSTAPMRAVTAARATLAEWITWTR